MNLKEEPPLEKMILLLIVTAVVGILLSELGAWELTGMIEAMSMLGLTAALVILYGSQGDVLEEQAGFLEDQNKMFQQEYSPELRFDSRSEQRGDIVKVDVRNKGAGLALDIGFEITVENDDERHTAFCPEVRKNGSPKSPGVLEGLSEDQKRFEIRLPDLDSSDEEPPTEPFSVALEEYSYAENEEYRMRLRERYSDAKGDVTDNTIRFDGPVNLEEVKTASDLGSL